MDQISVDEKQNNISFGSDDDVFIDVTRNRVQIGFNNYNNQRVHEILSMREIIETNRLLNDVIEHWAQNNLDYDSYLHDAARVAKAIIGNDPVIPVDEENKNIEVLRAALKTVLFICKSRGEELLELKGPCRNDYCTLHQAHRGPCYV